MRNLHAIAAVALASGAFGGAVGALATAATESQASPTAIAAALQRVQDTKAEQRLGTISSELNLLDGERYAIENDLYDICLSTQLTAASSSSTPPVPEVCSSPPLARDRR